MCVLLSGWLVSAYIQVIILGLCIVCAYLIKEYRFYYLPESGAAMLVGLIVGIWCVADMSQHLFARPNNLCIYVRVCDINVWSPLALASSSQVGKRWSFYGSM